MWCLLYNYVCALWYTFSKTQKRLAMTGGFTIKNFAQLFFTRKKAVFMM